MAFISYAQAKEDIHLLRALKGVHHDVGFYIDVGANDPEIDSVTKLFYDHGWRGVNVEPSPKWFARLVEQRPRDVNIAAAVTETPGSVTFFDHDGGGLGTTVESIAQSHGDDHRVELKPRTVDAITLTEICERHAPEVIHFLKIDVEGAEGSALRSMDFTRFRPWILCVESHVPLRTDLQTHAEWDGYVLEAGYQFVFTDLINRYYVANEHAERAASFAYPADYYMAAQDARRLREVEHRLLALAEEVRALRAGG